MNRILPALWILLTLAGCQRETLHHARILQFGTLIDVTLIAEPAVADRAIAMLERDFAAMQHDWQVWKPGPLQRLNDAIAAGEPIEPDPSLPPLIAKATALARASNHLFNPAAGRLVALWGFHRDNFGRTTEPAADTIRHLVDARPTMEDLYYDGTRLRSRNRLVKLDFGGIAKGYALALEARKLKAMGIDDFLLNAGGDLVAWGKHGQRHWKIGVRRVDGNGALASIEPRNGEAIFTSGDYERYYDSTAGRRHHIIDPRSGHPARQAHAVTVIHTDPATADAAATALMIARPGERLTVARRMGVTQFLIVAWDGELLLTPAMRARLTLAPDVRYYRLLE